MRLTLLLSLIFGLPAGGASACAVAEGCTMGPAPTAVERIEADMVRVIRTCWSPVAGAPPVTVSFQLARDGALDGKVRLVEPRRSEGRLVIKGFEAAERALQRCQPYDLPPEAFESWKEMTITFNPIAGDS
ncbi:cell envelope integrity protein TolA [Pelagovum pacificum]|uniref:Cell envelope integrity protein TolA n=1 Tax=Pelagovum pacificum TaxID=2588711 RepID=A0A5C5GAE5_9RHOB|nr:cell envelope integrity protein TolA [Pelagovum pacificum]QQA41662.1 cell envelope integrity protein TolA [Pelagovum pacificum]TNY30942.1 cell envelope integrity protein TolA [Pelagovum pacificum]